MVGISQERPKTKLPNVVGNHRKVAEYAMQSRKVEQSSKSGYNLKKSYLMHCR